MVLSLNMHEIEPFFNWRDKYIAEDDKLSPFYGKTYNEFAYEKAIYNYYIHPQWDDIESESLFVKLLYADYEDSYAIIELFGEWNDALNNDIMLLRRELIDPLVEEGIIHFIIIGENILNFHGSEDDYYKELNDDIEEKGGWIVGLNFREHVIEEMDQFNITYSIHLRPPFDDVKWRPYEPKHLFENIQELFGQWLEEGVLKLNS